MNEYNNAVRAARENGHELASEMTKREAFAMAAVQGIASGMLTKEPLPRVRAEYDGVPRCEMIAEEAMDIADALLLLLSTHD